MAIDLSTSFAVKMPHYMKNLWNNVVAAHLKCDTKDAKYLAILDLIDKIDNEKENYYIGGTYDEGLDLLFMFNVRKFMAGRFLINLFVCNKRPGSFSITVEDREVDDRRVEEFILKLADNETKSFINLPANSYSFVKTLSLDEKELSRSVFLIGIKIENDDNIGSKDIRDFVQSKHTSSFENMWRNMERFDVIVESNDGCKFSTHKCVLAVGSPLLKEMLNNSTSSQITLDEKQSDVESLLLYLYTGKMENITGLDLLKFAIKYSLNDLMKPHFYEITEENCIDYLVVCHENKLSEFTKTVYEFSRDHSTVITSEAWTNLHTYYIHNLKDIDIMKGLLENVVMELNKKT